MISRRPRRRHRRSRGARARAARAGPRRPTGRSVRHYRAARHVAGVARGGLAHLAPGNDAFPEEKDAAEIAARLAELWALLRAGRFEPATRASLAPDFRGGRLQPSTEAEYGIQAGLGVVRSTAMSGALVLDRDRRSRDALAAFVGRARQPADGGASDHRDRGALGKRAPRAHTEVRYDLVGSGRVGSGRARGTLAARVAARAGRRLAHRAGWRSTTSAAVRRGRSSRRSPTRRSAATLPSGSSSVDGLDAWVSRRTRSSRRAGWATTASRSATPTATGSTTSTSRSRPAFRTGSSATRATARSRT